MSNHVKWYQILSHVSIININTDDNGVLCRILNAKKGIPSQTNFQALAYKFYNFHHIPALYSHWGKNQAPAQF